MYQINLAGKFHMSLRTLADVFVFLNASLPPAGIEVFKDGAALTVARNDYGKFGITQPGNVEELFLSMLNEVDMHYIRPHGIVRQPYEMLPDEWKAFTALGSVAYNVFPCFDVEQRRQQCSFVDDKGETKYGTIEYFMSRHMLSRFDYGHNGPLYGNARQSNNRHEVQVAYALAAGKAVPFEVIEWYRANPKKVHSVGEWFSVVLERPEYRGRMSDDKLHHLANLLKWERIELTNENSPYFIRLMEELPDDASRTLVDDFLYGKGVLKPYPIGTVSGTPPDLSQAYSPFALLLRERLGESRKQHAIEVAQEHRVKNLHSLRELERSLKEAEQLPALSDLRFPNLFAEAIDKRGIDVMLTYLDTSNEHNMITKKAVQEVFGFKVVGLKTAERRDAIFAFCGYDSQMRAQYEKGVATKKAASERAREAGYAKEVAEATKVSFNGEVISGAEYVDRCVADGYTVISTSKKGAALQYWLSNPQTNCSRSVQKKDGTLEYAQLVHGLTEFRQAA